MLLQKIGIIFKTQKEIECLTNLNVMNINRQAYLRNTRFVVNQTISSETTKIGKMLDFKKIDLVFFVFFYFYFIFIFLLYFYYLNLAEKF